MLITKEIEIDLGHRIPSHKSKCRNIHGHRYRIEVGVDDKIISEKGESSEGMVIDFSDLKDVMMKVLDLAYDHGFVMYEFDEFAETFQNFNSKIVFVPFIPTAENLAMHWFQILEGPLKLKGVKLNHVKVWETPSSTALYTTENKPKYDTSTN